MHLFPFPGWFASSSFRPLETSIFPNRVNGQEDVKRAFLSHANAFQSHSISENMRSYETLLHFSTNDYQEDVGGAERAKELIV